MQPLLLQGFFDVIRGGKICIRISINLSCRIYVRLSKEDGRSFQFCKIGKYSISNQKALILDFLKDKKDIEVVSVGFDDGYTGY